MTTSAEKPADVTPTLGAETNDNLGVTTYLPKGGVGRRRWLSSSAESTADVAPTFAVLCHLCQMPLGEDFVWLDGRAWCHDIAECSFRARRRLGVPLRICYEQLARDRERQADDARDRATWAEQRPRSNADSEFVAYIASGQWQEFADEQRLLAFYRCEVCGQRDYDLQVHHRDYGNLGRELPQDVLVVCSLCHRQLEPLRRAGQHPSFTVSVAALAPGAPERRIVGWPGGRPVFANRAPA